MRGSGFNLQAGQIGISVEGTGSFQTADVYDSFIEARGNISGAGAKAISVTNGGDLRLGQLNTNFEGPNTSYLLYTDNVGTSLINMAGNISPNGLLITSAGTSDQISVPQLNADFTVQNGPFVNSNQQALNSKILWHGNNFRYGIPDDSFNYAYFQLFKRTTTNPSDPEVDAEPTSGNMQTNLLYCNLNGCGVGAGYGPSATRGGTNAPSHDLEFNGTFGNQTNTAGISSTGLIYGTALDFNLLPNGSIKNTNGHGYSWHHLLNTAPGSDTMVLDVISPSSSFLRQALIINADGSTSIPGSLTVGNGFSGTKTAGSCVFTIVSGIITNVTGC
jgi:hypothetical protein